MFSRALRVTAKRAAATTAKTASHRSIDAPPPAPGLLPLQDMTRSQLSDEELVWPATRARTPFRPLQGCPGCGRPTRGELQEQLHWSAKMAANSL